jgi:hypothetical protein
MARDGRAAETGVPTVAKSFKGYDDFSAANVAAKRAVAADVGLAWHLVSGASVLARLPATWTACKVFARVSRSPRDVRLPAARYWPNGILPVGPVYEAEYAWAAPFNAEPIAEAA